MFNPLGATNTWAYAVAVIEWALELHNFYIVEDEVVVEASNRDS